jgi:hypothetical protein
VKKWTNIGEKISFAPGIIGTTTSQPRNNVKIGIRQISEYFKDKPVG